MESVIWIDSDTEDLDDLVEFVEPPTVATPRKIGPLAGPSKIVNTPQRRTPRPTPQKKRARSPESDSDIEIIETPRAAKVSKPLSSSSADEDRALALALQKQWDDEDAFARERAAETEEQSLRLIQRLQKMDESVTEKRRKLAQSRDVPDDGIVFQVVIDADGKTLEGDEDPDNAAHLDIVKRDFEQALADGLKLKTAHWFVNAKLEARFEAAKETLSSLGIDTTERNLFHGTDATNIQPILRNGFLIPGVSPGVAMVNGAARGIGIYLATTPLTSLGYTRGANKMFMCRVITGRTTPQSSHTIPLPLGQNSFESYENGGICVVKHVELVVPRYVVEFEMNALGNPYGGIWGGAALAGLGGGAAMAHLAAMPRLMAPPAVMPPMPMGALGVAANPYGMLPAVPPLGAGVPRAARSRKQAPAKPKLPSKRAVKGKGKVKQVDDGEAG
ncbi:hypothetical protein B0H17DRAFT_1050445 [Mycena rosella]|uniref:PARP catalytic domain-containing protein n=1 Tax=Mycena rosella TaxID=1033263 RepID=A0AAD7GPB1_MYCRO|nr:hypothetical protein B0H17DRAFT_1050445 [Mycena rosella]